MKRAQLLLSCTLLAISLMLPHYVGGFPTAGTVPSQASKATSATRKGSIINLKSIEPLKEAFQRDSGKIRLVALLSPT
jgi:hypothetical protein